MAGMLYVVATPLGNLEDMSYRAIRVLGEVSVIAAEDTRHSRKLLSHFGIHTPLVSYYDQAERRKAPQLIERLRAGQSVALISDAGTPGIADPGYHLVRAALDAGISVVPIPGPSAIAAAVSVAGLPVDRFVFEGFIPARPAARRAFFEQLRSETRTVVCFEAGRRLVASLRDLLAVVGARDVVVAREVTKLFEEFVRGTLPDVLAQIGDAPVRGEATLLIGPPPRDAATPTADEMRRALAELRAKGVSVKESARRLAQERGWPRREIYQLALAEARRGSAESTPESGGQTKAVSASDQES